MASDMMSLSDFCLSDRQREIIAAYLETGSSRKAAKKTGINGGHAARVIKKVKDRAAIKGWSPEHDMTKPVPDAYVVKGTSTLYDADGNMQMQWVKTSLDMENKEQIVREMCEALMEDVVGKAKPIKSPASADHDLLTAYLFADPHIGMYAWADETGNDYNCEIAERNLCTAMARLVDRSPPSHEAVICNLGDFFHSDSTDNRTKRSGHALDVDSRWSRVVRIGVRALRHCIQLALAKHRKVTLINEIGNHDDQSSLMLGMIMEGYFANEPRLTINTSPMHYHYYEFGKVLIGTHHGHLIKPADLGDMMLADHPEACGRTLYRHWFTGHIHHETRKEFRSYTHESKAALAAKDVYAASNGYRSQRAMESVIYHREWGEEDRNRVGIRWIESAAKDLQLAG